MKESERKRVKEIQSERKKERERAKERESERKRAKERERERKGDEGEIEQAKRRSPGGTVYRFNPGVCYYLLRNAPLICLDIALFINSLVALTLCSAG